MQHSAFASGVHTKLTPPSPSWAEALEAPRAYALPIPKLYTGTQAELAERLVDHLTALCGFRPIAVRQRSTKSYLRHRRVRGDWPAPLFGPRVRLYALDATGEWEPIPEALLACVLQAWALAPTPVGDRGRFLLLNNVDRPIALAKAMCEQHPDLPAPDSWRATARPMPAWPPARASAPVNPSKGIPFEEWFPPTPTPA